MKLTITLIVTLFLLAGCTAMKNLELLVADAKDAVVEVKAVLAETKLAYATAKEAADVNKDGKTSSSEWIAWLAGGGLTTLLAGLKLVSLQKQTNELYDATHAPIAGPVAAK